jgi:hypothetical protein
MMTQGNLVAAKFLCEIKHLFATHPRAEETGLLLLSLALVGLIVLQVKIL